MGFAKSGGLRACAFTMIANGDTNHVQPFVLDSTSEQLTVVVNIATSSANFIVPPNDDIWTYWTKLTVTYNTTGSVSETRLYLNSTLIGKRISNGKILRWSDQSTLLLGGYSLSATSTVLTERFEGWMDDLAFYSRVLSPKEISSKWHYPANTSDSSLFIYYDFDDGPSSSIATNRGLAGSVADLYNGKVFGGLIYFDSNSQSIRSATSATWVSPPPLPLVLFSKYR